MKRRNQRQEQFNERLSEDKYAILKRTDRAVLKYLKELAQLNENRTCLTSIPKIASACDISNRQVQISTRRLIEAAYIERLGYDFVNADRAMRGTTYRILTPELDTQQSTKEKVRGIKFLMLWSEVE